MNFSRSLWSVSQHSVPEVGVRFDGSLIYRKVLLKKSTLVQPCWWPKLQEYKIYISIHHNFKSYKKDEINILCMLLQVEPFICSSQVSRPTWCNSVLRMDFIISKLAFIPSWYSSPECIIITVEELVTDTREGLRIRLGCGQCQCLANNLLLAGSLWLHCSIYLSRHYCNTPSYHAYWMRSL